MGTFIFDYNFAAKKHLSCGISPDSLVEYKKRIQTGVEKLQAMVSGGKVGFPNLPKQDIAPILAFAKEAKGKYDDVVVAGIGGSALGIEAFINAIMPYGWNAMSLEERGYFPRMWLADNVDPSKVACILDRCKKERTLVIVISKSGSTVETAQNFSLFYDWLASGVKDIKKHIAVVTDPAKGPLREFADKNSLPSFPIEAAIGGRFSVLSPVGLLPAALLGIDIVKMLKGADDITKNAMEKVITASAIYYHGMEHGKSIHVLMPYSSRLDKFAEWFCQLWGESLGKKVTYSGKVNNFGSTPVRAVGAIDQHSQIQLFREGPADKIVTFVELSKHDREVSVTGRFHEAFNYLNGMNFGTLLNMELQATEAALLTSGVPSVKICIDKLDEFALGQLFMFFQYIVPIVGLAADINPFDQPGVEEAKEYAYGLMNRAGFENKKAQFNEIYKKDSEFTV